jgi:hypothetical protein
VKKLETALGGGCEHPGQERFSHRRRLRRTIPSGIKYLFKEFLQACGRDYNNEFRLDISGVLEGMRDSSSTVTG